MFVPQQELWRMWLPARFGPRYSFGHFAFFASPVHPRRSFSGIKLQAAVQTADAGLEGLAGVKRPGSHAPRCKWREISHTAACELRRGRLVTRKGLIHRNGRIGGPVTGVCIQDIALNGSCKRSGIGRGQRAGCSLSEDSAGRAVLPVSHKRY